MGSVVSVVEKMFTQIYSNTPFHQRRPTSSNHPTPCLFVTALRPNATLQPQQGPAQRMAALLTIRCQSWATKHPENQKVDLSWPHKGTKTYGFKTVSRRWSSWSMWHVTPTWTTWPRDICVACVGDSASSSMRHLTQGAQGVQHATRCTEVTHVRRDKSLWRTWWTMSLSPVESVKPVATT